MEPKNKYLYRNKDVLTVLRSHGSLSFSAIEKILFPPMKKKSLRKTIHLLKKRKAIASRTSNGGKVFYQISQNLTGRTAAAKILKCEPSQLFQPVLSDREWIHTELTEYWIALLQRQFPEAAVIRERDFYDNEVAQRVMLIKKDEFELKPDFLLLFRKSDTLERVSIAVEIERSRKSGRRLAAKVKKYADKTFLDGLIYACDSDRISETIRLIYRNKILDRAHRIKHYADNFILLSDAINTHIEPLSQLYNSNEKPVSIVDWVNYLRVTKRNFRRDSEFKQMDTGTPSPSVRVAFN